MFSQTYLLRPGFLKNKLKSKLGLKSEILNAQIKENSQLKFEIIFFRNPSLIVSYGFLIISYCTYNYGLRMISDTYNSLLHSSH